LNLWRIRRRKRIQVREGERLIIARGWLGIEVVLLLNSGNIWLIIEVRAQDIPATNE